MSRLLSITLVFVALGCARKAPVPIDDPVPVVVVPEPPDDGSIPPPRPVAVRSQAEALALGVDYLLKQQSPDGAWRSDVYATFKDGVALTPFAVTALQEAHDAGVRTPAVETAIRNACERLATFVKDGTVVPPADGFDYPLYTAALTLKAFSHPTATDFAKHRAAWVKYIKERQLTEKLGWKPEDKQYGGWGYCRVIPQKPEPGKLAPTLIESNLSATLFALDALKAAGETDAEVYKAALVFLRRCQTVHASVLSNHQPWAGHLDGGFHFIYDDPTRNKAGVVPKEDASWPELFYSYGSTTADGFRALYLCDQSDDVVQKMYRDWARNWLLINFRADHHPGTYLKTHESNRDAVYYYYAASVARAFRDHKLELSRGRNWREELSYALASRQAKDGSWTNPIELVRENDPIVATSSAVLALARSK